MFACLIIYFSFTTSQFQAWFSNERGQEEINELSTTKVSQILLHLDLCDYVDRCDYVDLCITVYGTIGLELLAAV